MTEERLVQVGAQDAFVRAERSDMSSHTARCTTLRLRTRTLLTQLRALVGCEVDIEHISRRRADHLAVVPRFR
jgi:hypothetical protein